MNFNSTIMDKYTTCCDCKDGILKPTIAGRCKMMHYSIYRKKLLVEKQKAKAKFRSLEHSENNKSLLVKKEKIVDNELELWYKIRMNTLEPICANCGAMGQFLIEEKYKKLWKSCQAHLLPKSKFKSISHHPLNGLVLGSGYSGLCHCHDTYDSSWEAASKMNIWPEVINRFKIFYPLLKPEEHQFIPKVLLKTLP